MARLNSGLWINVESGAGAHIRDVIAEAIELAGRLGCDVASDFSGVRLYVTARSTVDEVLATYERRFAQDAERWREEARELEAAGRRVAARIRTMGDLVCREDDAAADRAKFPRAMLIQFDSEADLKRALADGLVRISFLGGPP